MSIDGNHFLVLTYYYIIFMMLVMLRARSMTPPCLGRVDATFQAHAPSIASACTTERASDPTPAGLYSGSMRVPSLLIRHRCTSGQEGTRVRRRITAEWLMLIGPRSHPLLMMILEDYVWEREASPTASMNGVC
jgi:hypothetical protein